MYTKITIDGSVFDPWYIKLFRAIGFYLLIALIVLIAWFAKVKIPANIVREISLIIVPVIFVLLQAVIAVKPRTSLRRISSVCTIVWIFLATYAILNFR
jgi:hypothetical protein